MKSRSISYSVVVAALAGALSLLLVSMPAAQNGAPAANPADRPTPLLANGYPDFSGFYGGKYGTETGGR